MEKIEQEKLINKLIIASNEISKKRNPSANYMFLDEAYVRELADSKELSFDEMVELLRKRFSL